MGAVDVKSGEEILFNNGQSNVFGHLPRRNKSLCLTPDGMITFVGNGEIDKCAFGAEMYASTGVHLEHWDDVVTGPNNGVLALDVTGSYAMYLRRDQTVSVWSATDGHFLWSRGIK